MESTEAVLVEQGNVAAYKAEQETQNTIARTHPRDPRKALDNALLELEIAPEYACKSFYVIPFKDRSGGEERIVNVEGPSIKAAITLARTWGNNASGWRIKDQSTERVEVEGVYVDHETNVRTVRAKTASRFYTDKKTGKKVPLREEALVKAIAAAGSKAVRDAILAGEPFWYTDSYYKKAREIAAKTIGGKANVKAKPKTYEEKVAWIADRLLQKGVTPAVFKTYLDSLDQTQSEDERIADIVGVYNAINDGQVKIEEVFTALRVEAKAPPVPKRASEQGPAEDANNDAADVVFKVARVAKTEHAGKQVWVVMTTDRNKYLVESEAVAKFAELAVKDGAALSATLAEQDGKDWILTVERAK